MVVDENNQLWFYSAGQVMRFQDGNFEQVSTFTGTETIHPFGNNQAYFRTDPNEIAFYDGSETTSIPFTLYSPYFLHLVHADPEGGLWVDIENVGLAYYNGVEWQMITIPGSNSPTQYVFELTLDADGNPWFGFMDGGIRTLQDGEWIQYYNDDWGSGFAETIRSILQWGNKMVFSIQGKLVFLENEEFTELDCTEAPFLCSLSFQDMATDSEENLWLTNLLGDSELIKYDGSVWEAFDPFPGISAYAQCVYASSEDEIYIGTNNAASFLEAGYAVSVLEDFDQKAGVSLYPNPSHGMFKIKTNPGDEIHRIDLIDVQGKVLKTWSSSESTYDISNVGNGIYILKVNLNGEYMTARILKQ